MTNDHALDPDQLERFADDGYLLLSGVLPTEIVNSLRGTFAEVVDVLAHRWHKMGAVADPLVGVPFEERYLRLIQNPALRLPAAWRRILVSRPVYELWQQPSLLGAARSILGDEVFAHGVWNGRPRDPLGRSQQVTWHQDAYYYKGWRPSHSPLLSVWVPLVPVDEHRACMQYVTGSHKHGWIERTRLNNGEYGTAADPAAGNAIFTARMRPGDAVIFADTTVHRSTPNLSERVRWSIDIRYGRPMPEVIAGGSRGYRCFSASDPSSVETYETWAARYGYAPEELLDELTNFEEGYDIEALQAFSAASPYADIY
ncbi:phytanoyl-CoA dioxygenase family protein [Nonomuraea sp. NPDC050556]|uniref:phytanoyl-CoA dioxygenase family protein n=1 Tax=Nonomuraea sp. NPDC050556 TaxID=3364369 RepID=UPI0037A8C0F2